MICYLCETVFNFVIKGFCAPSTVSQDRPEFWIQRCGFRFTGTRYSGLLVSGTCTLDYNP